MRSETREGDVTEQRGVIVDPQAPGKLAIASVPAPAPASTELIVRVRAFSLNRGEVRRADTAPAGWRPGWDFAGVVERPAESGGPREGARVVGLLPEGAWSEHIAAPVTSVAELPDAVTFSQAAALPV